MASTKEHLEKALWYLQNDKLSSAENELENAISHYKIEEEMRQGKDDSSNRIG